MRKTSKQLKAASEFVFRFTAVSMLLTAVHIPNAKAQTLAALNPSRGVLAPVLPFIDTGTRILNGKPIVDENTQASKKLWELFDFANAQEMQDKLQSMFVEHERAMEIANASVTEQQLQEAMANLPEDFVGPTGMNKKIVAKKASAVIKNVASASPSGSYLQPESLPVSANFAQPVASAEGLVQPCKPGEPCAKSKALAEQIAANMERNNPTLDANFNVVNNSASKSTRSPASALTPTSYAKGGINPNLFANTSGDHAAQPVSTRVASAPVVNLGKDPVESASFVANPRIEDVVNSDVFEKMPEGWFAQKDPDTGVVVRGALDKEYNTKNDNDPNNFIQIAVTKDIPNGLKKGVYTMKKCKGACYTHYYKKMKEFLAALATGKLPKGAKPPAIPGVLEATTAVEVAKVDAEERDKLLKNSDMFANDLRKAIDDKRRAGGLQIKKRDDFWYYIQKLRDGQREGDLLDKMVNNVTEA